MFHALFISTLVIAAVTPLFISMAFLQIIVPVALVFCAIHVKVAAITISLVFKPHSIVDISVCMPKYSFAISFIFMPFPDKLCPILPVLSPWSMSQSIFQVAFVDCSI
jgi:hypothetical protein